MSHIQDVHARIISTPRRIPPRQGREANRSALNEKFGSCFGDEAWFENLPQDLWAFIDGTLRACARPSSDVFPGLNLQKDLYTYTFAFIFTVPFREGSTILDSSANHISNASRRV